MLVKNRFPEDNFQGSKVRDSLATLTLKLGLQCVPNATIHLASFFFFFFFICTLHTVKHIRLTILPFMHVSLTYLASASAQLS